MRLLWKSASFILFLVQFCRGVDLGCTPTHRGNLTYRIDKSQLSEDKVSNCDYSWNNSTMVLATHKGEPTQEMNSSLDTLETSECFARLHWKAHCTSKKTKFIVDFTANCTTSCVKKEDKDGHSAAVTITASVVLIVLVFLLIFLPYKYIKKNCSGSCSQCGGLYTNVKTQNPDPAPLQVMV